MIFINLINGNKCKKMKMLYMNVVFDNEIARWSEPVTFSSNQDLCNYFRFFVNNYLYVVPDETSEESDTA